MKVIDRDNLEQTKELQRMLLEDYGIEASLHEIQKAYYKFCGCCGYWNDINSTFEKWDGVYKQGELFCQQMVERLEELGDY